MATAAEVWADLDDEALTRARRFHRFYRLLAAMAAPRAALLYLRLRLRSPAGLRWLRRGGYSPWRAARAIAAGRLVRRAQRTTGRTPSPVVVWPAGMPSSCVIAYFHTTWDVVIAREVRDRRYCLIRSGPRRAEDLGQQHVAEDTAGLKSLVRRVAEGARCAVAADNFVPGPEPGFLGTGHALNPAATRLAAITGAPLVTLWPTYQSGVLRFDLGTPIAASTCAELPDEALRTARQFFENAVRSDLASWRRIVSFLERAPDTGRPELASGGSIAQRSV
ncbi:MAG TPA: hypothetical protein VKA43_09860 [Gammaproteobacteria bacterium]|nr:hypothetical protein [Gammaproteobacteria bacterium]